MHASICDLVLLGIARLFCFLSKLHTTTIVWGLFALMKHFLFTKIKTDLEVQFLLINQTITKDEIQAGYGCKNKNTPEYM